MSRLTKDETEDIIYNSLEIYEKELNLTRKRKEYYVETKKEIYEVDENYIKEKTWIEL
jgi:hypothetical protein